jgi:hypothetical protein
MGQASNSGRNASLDNKKLRAAGRPHRNDPSQTAVDEGLSSEPDRGTTGGAFGVAATPKEPTPPKSE